MASEMVLASTGLTHVLIDIVPFQWSYRSVEPLKDGIRDIVRNAAKTWLELRRGELVPLRWIGARLARGWLYCLRLGLDRAQPEMMSGVEELCITDEDSNVVDFMKREGLVFNVGNP